MRPYAIQSTLVKLPTFTTTEDLVRFVKEGQTKDTNPQRFKVLLHDAVLQQQKGVDCVNSHFLVEDVAAVKRTDENRGHAVGGNVAHLPSSKKQVP